ncbi:MAG: NAD(P)-dependent oxidoreductase [Myxococcota bacterium]
MPSRPVRILTHLPPSALGPVSERFPDLELVQVPQEEDPPAELAGDVLLTFAWGSPNLAKIAARGVRWIHTIGTGVDRFPLDAVGDRILTCSRGASAVPIAEWVLAMLLAHEKNLPEAWVHEPPERWTLAELGGLHDKTLGLVGLGGIARAVALRALPFGMRVRAVRRSAGPSPIEGVECVGSLDELLGTADHLVIAAAATPETRHLIGREALKRVVRGVHLVNVARGSLVDEQALREALDDGRVARASLDVFETEPLPAGHWLYAHPRVRVSPHISWSMPGAVERLIETFADNVGRYLAGEPLEGTVDLQRGY